MTKLLLTCEHGGNKIPRAFKKYFENASADLDSHKGYDPGALNLFKKIALVADVAYSSQISRLLVELNRSLHSKNLFSKYTCKLSSEEKNEILNKYYFPYRNEVQKKIEKFISADHFLLHVSVHSFISILNSEVRNNDIGLLYDPANEDEKRIANAWKNILSDLNPALKVRFNYPYLGTADGFTTFLRKYFKKNYAGIELEVNQKFSEKNKMDKKIVDVILRSMETLKHQYLS